MAESPQPTAPSPIDNGELSKVDDFGAKADTLGHNHLLTDFEPADGIDPDERYLVRR
jgi:hypothetical protein